MTRPLKDRFWEKVDVRGYDDCWLWTGGVNNKGYGVIFNGIPRGLPGRGMMLAHRAAWGLAHVPAPSDLEVCHRCDNPLCVNEAHLFLATHAENMTDRDSKGRANTPRGERHGSAKLTNAEIIAIRATSGKRAEVGARYGVSPTTVSQIVNWRLWQHVEDEKETE